MKFGKFAGSKFKKQKKEVVKEYHSLTDYKTRFKLGMLAMETTLPKDQIAEILKLFGYFILVVALIGCYFVGQNVLTASQNNLKVNNATLAECNLRCNQNYNNTLIMYKVCNRTLTYLTGGK